MLIRKLPVEVEAWSVRELNHAAEHDWRALPEAVRADHDNPKGEGGWVFGALIEKPVCTGDEAHGPHNKAAKFCAECGAPIQTYRRRGIYVPTLEGNLFAAPDDYIVRGIQGEFYPIKPEILAGSYEVVSE